MSSLASEIREKLMEIESKANSPLKIMRKVNFINLEKYLFICSFLNIISSELNLQIIQYL